MIVKINKRAVLVACELFFLNRVFTFRFITFLPIVNETYVLISEVITIYEVFSYLYKRICQRKANCISDVIFVLIGLYYFYLFVNSVIQDTNIRRVFMAAYPVLGTIAFLYNNCSKDYKSLLEGTAFYFKITILLTIFDAVFVQHFLTQSTISFLIGGRNQIAITLVMALSFISVDINEKYNRNGRIKMQGKIISLFYLILILFLGFKSGSSTVLLCTAVMLALYILSKKGKYLGSTVFLFGYAAGWLGLVVLRLHSVLANFIWNGLHKDLTLSHRTIIWDVALDQIKRRPYFGYGNPDSYNVFLVNHDYTGGNNNVWTLISGHNQVIQILYYGGVLMLLIFIAIIFIATKRSNRFYDSYMFFVSVVVISLTWMSEVPGEYGMFLALGMCYLSQLNNKRRDYR